MLEKLAMALNLGKLVTQTGNDYEFTECRKEK